MVYFLSPVLECQLHEARDSTYIAHSYSPKIEPHRRFALSTYLWIGLNQ